MCSSRQLKTKRWGLKPFSPKPYSMAAPWSKVVAAAWSEVVMSRLKIPQDPPGVKVFSKRSTFSPRLARRAAAVNPERPEPMMRVVLGTTSILFLIYVFFENPYPPFFPERETLTTNPMHVVNFKSIHLSNTLNNHHTRGHTNLNCGLRDAMILGDTASALYNMMIVLIAGAIFFVIGSIITDWRESG